MRVVVLAIAGIVAWRLLRRGTTVERVTVGWTDGSSIELDPGHPGRERLLASAEALLA